RHLVEDREVRGYTAAAMNAARIGVLAGGESPEREVSLRSGERVHRALVARGYRAELLVLDRLDDLVGAIDGVDIVFSCLHGGAGENGTVQLLLDLLGVPYTGCGARAASRSMDKIRSRNLFATRGLAVPEGLEWKGQPAEGFVDAIRDRFSFPVVVKPTGEGSSIGVEIVDDAADLRSALERVTEGFGSALVEEYIPGQELTVGILEIGGEVRALPVIEIRPSGRFFNYDAKYVPGASKFLVPAPLEEDVAAAVQAASLEAHDALGCRGYSRVDLRLHEDGTPYVLEVNVLPGMTDESDLPRAASASGLGFEDLVEAMLATATKEEE
ncbi:MAG: D-alanine--D-alanine ligase, partial [Candidatus Bipolaricaulota bacterium]